MNKRFSVALWAAIIFQWLTGLVHSFTFLIVPVAANPTEAQMLDLMSTYKMDMGNGIFRTYSEVVITLSVNLTLLCLMAGLINWFLKRKKVREEIWKGMLLIQCLIFGALFLVVIRYGFLPPMICTGLIFFGCLIARITAPNIYSTKQVTT